jgi:hypothetical protein
MPEIRRVRTNISHLYNRIMYLFERVLFCWYCSSCGTIRDNLFSCPCLLIYFACSHGDKSIVSIDHCFEPGIFWPSETRNIEKVEKQPLKSTQVDQFMEMHVLLLCSQLYPVLNLQNSKEENINRLWALNSQTVGRLVSWKILSEPVLRPSCMTILTLEKASWLTLQIFGIWF